MFVHNLSYFNMKSRKLTYGCSRNYTVVCVGKLFHQFFINFSSILKKPVWEENTSNFFINFSSMFHQSYFNFKSYLRITLIHCFLYHFIMTTNSYIGDNFLSITTACRGGFINEKRRQQIILLNCKYV